MQTIENEGYKERNRRMYTMNRNESFFYCWDIQLQRIWDVFVMSTKYLNQNNDGLDIDSGMLASSTVIKERTHNYTQAL